MYRIDPARLTAHAGALTDDSGSTATATTYASDHITLEYLDTSFVYSKALFAANETVEALNSYFGALNTALTASATELQGTATRSLELDDAIEADLDRNYPGGGGSGATTSADDASSGSPHNAVDELSPPATETPEDLVSTILTTDWLSPSSVLAQVLDWIFDWNYLDVISKNFSGDWNKLYEVSDSLRKLGAYTGTQGDNVAYEMAVTAGSWTGEAATAANAFFTDLAELLREAGTKIAELGPEFEMVARGMISTAALLSGIFSKILDAALVAAVCIAAGTVTIETVVGGILGYLCGGIEIGYALWLAKSAYDTVQSVLTFFDALNASVGVLSSLLAGGTDIPLPVGYDNAQVN